MKIAVIHGQNHKGTTYGMAHSVLEHLLKDADEIQEFFLPKDGPGFCHGCYSCFMKGEETCPEATKVQPIAQAIEWADVILLASPNYVLEMSGAMKNLMDHLAYHWVTHRPHGDMFTKVGVTIASAAGAPSVHMVRSMAKQLKWLGVPQVYALSVACGVAPGEQLSAKKQQEIERKAEKLAKKVKRRVAHPRPSLRGKLMFGIFRKMQSAPKAAWNPTDRDWWVAQGWTGKTRPWKKQKQTYPS